MASLRRSPLFAPLVSAAMAGMLAALASAAPDCRFDGSRDCGPAGAGDAVFAAQSRISTGGIGRSSADMAAKARQRGGTSSGVPDLANKGGGGSGTSKSKISSAGGSGSESGSKVPSWLWNENSPKAYGWGMALGVILGIVAGIATANPWVGVATAGLGGLAIGFLFNYLNS